FEKGMNEKTIGQHFDLPWPETNFRLITDGVLNTDTKPREEFGDEAYQTLLDICNDVLKEWAAEPYLGRETNAAIMEEAMQRYSGKHGKVPKATGWAKVMHDLRRSNT